MSCPGACGGFVSVQVYRLVTPTVKDAEGYLTPTYRLLETIRCDKQPKSGEQIAKEYGITDANIKDILYPLQPTTALLNEKLIIGGKTYEVRHVADWGNFKDILIAPLNVTLVIVP